VINLGKLSKDARDLLIGKDGSEKEPNDFKTELQNAIKNGIINKTDGTLLITTRMNVDKMGEKINKAQENAVRKIKDNELYNSLEEELDAKREEDMKKVEEERKRKERDNAFNQQLKRNEKQKQNENSQKNIDEVIIEKEINSDKL